MHGRRCGIGSTAPQPGPAPPAGGVAHRAHGEHSRAGPGCPSRQANLPAPHLHAPKHSRPVAVAQLLAAEAVVRSARRKPTASPRKAGEPRRCTDARQLPCASAHPPPRSTRQAPYASGAVEVPAPVPHMARHVLQAPRAGLPAAERADPPLGSVPAPGDVIEPAVARAGRSRPAGVLPSGPGRQPAPVHTGDPRGRLGPTTQVTGGPQPLTPDKALQKWATSHHETPPAGSRPPGALPGLSAGDPCVPGLREGERRDLERRHLDGPTAVGAPVRDRHPRRGGGHLVDRPLPASTTRHPGAASCRCCAGLPGTVRARSTSPAAGPLAAGATAPAHGPPRGGRPTAPRASLITRTGPATRH